MYYCFTYACHDPYQAMQNYLTIQDGHYINGKKEKEWISTSRLYTFSPYDSSLAYTYLEWYSTEFRNDMKKGASAIYKSRDGKMYEEHYTFKNDTLEGPSSTKYPGREEKGEYKKNIPVGKWISIDSTNKYNSSSGISLNEATDIIHDTDVLNTIGDSLIQKIFLLKTENKLHNFVAGKTYEMTGQLSHVELRADTFYADLSVLTYPYRDTVFEDPEHYIYAIGGRGELMRSLFRNGFYTTQVSGSGFSNMKSYFRNKQLYISRIDSLEKSRTAISHFDVYYPSGKKYCTGHIILMNERYSELPFSSGRFPEFPKQKIDTLPYFHGGFNLNNNCFKDGFWIYWNEDGSLKKKMYYNAGMLQSVSTK